MSRRSNTVEQAEQTDTEGHAAKRAAKRPANRVREDKPADTEGHRSPRMM